MFPQLLVSLTVGLTVTSLCQATVPSPSPPPAVTCIISGLPANISEYQDSDYPFASSLLHIYEWMRPSCDGKITAVTFVRTSVNMLGGRFYLGVFQALQLSEANSTYYQLIDYIAVNATTRAGYFQTFHVPDNITLRMGRKNVIGIFYDKWDTPQDQLIVPYNSVTDDTSRYFKAYVGFMSFAQLRNITQLRVGGELGIKASGRRPALKVTVSPIPAGLSENGARMCFPPPSIENGVIVAGSSTAKETGKFMPGDVALYSCNPGFALGSNIYSICVHGQWMPVPVCLGSCGRMPPKIPLAGVTMKSFADQSRVGDVIHYHCNMGFTLAPGSQSKVICEEMRPGDFRWSEKPVCLPSKLSAQMLLNSNNKDTTDDVVCPTAGEEIENGELESKTYTEVAYPGDSVTYQCKAGYTVSAFEMFCRPDGTWSQLPECMPTEVTNELVAQTATELPFVSSAAPSISCGNPPNISNAFVVRKSYIDRDSAWLDTVIYECITGFRMVSMSIVGCSQNGTWVGFPNFPECELAPQNRREDVVSGTCGVAPRVPNARIGVFRVRNATGTTTTTQVALASTEAPFEFVQYECNPGFRLSSKLSVVTCNYVTQQWSETPQCTRKQANETSTTTALPASRIAKAGRQPSEAVARNAILTGGQITCGEALEIDNGRIQSKSFSNRLSVAGDTVTYNCLQGFVLVGKQTISCDRFLQTWEEEPRCLVSCGDPPNVAGGRVVIKDFHNGQSIVGSYAKYACEIGMTLRSSDTIICQRDHQWNIIPVCVFGGEIATACPSPPDISNGTVISRSYTSNRANWFDTVRYACDQGFHPDTNDPTITCNSDGTWTRLPRCMPNPSCGAAPFVTNGFVYASNFSNELSEIGSYIRYRCRGGFRLMGLDLVFCEANLKWSRLPTCEIIYCDPPPVVTNGQVFNQTYPSSSRPQDGDRVAYVCNRGFSIETGTPTIVCLYDGTWTKEPRCVSGAPLVPATCGAPLRLPHGGIQSSSFRYLDGQSSSIGDNVVYLCDSQYFINGQANVQCLETGLWSTMPTCILGCGPPPVISNGHVDDQSFSETSSPGAFVRYVCNVGYSMTGDSVMTCGDNGLWYGNMPTCSSQRRKCTFIPTVDNGKEFSRSFSPEATTAAVGDYVTFICDVGRTMQGRRDVACLNDGSWSVLPECKGDSPSTCGEPPNVVNAIIQTTNFLGRASQAGDSATYRCTNGFHISGSSNMVATCESTGRWINVPSCTLSCGSAPDITNGFVTTSTFLAGSSFEGSTARYSCFDGYTLQGQSTIRCENGIWTQVPSCRTAAAFCSGIPTVRDGHETSRTFTSVQALAGDQITFACDSAFVMQGQPTVTCLDSGVWSSPPTCNIDWNKADTCGNAPANITFGRLEHTSYIGRQSLPGDAAYYTCFSGYAIYGTNTAFCGKNNHWSALPRCVLTCGAAPMINQGAIVWQNFTSTLPSTPSAAVRYMCNPGFSIRGPDIIVCQQNGRWTAPPNCGSGRSVTTSITQCMSTPTIQNGDAVVTTFVGRQPVPGDQITYACSGNFEMVGSETVTCRDDGIWSQLPRCIEGGQKCPRPPIVEHGMEQSRTYQTVLADPGERVQYTCNEGYRLLGRDTITCLPDGTWSGSPQCAAVTVANTCGMAPVLNNGRVVRQSFAVGETSRERDTVTFDCNPGFTLAGQDTITCSPIGTWTILPSCREEQRTCGYAPVLANGQIIRQSFTGTSRPSDTVTYICNDEFSMSGSATITCDPLATQWTLVPVCISVPKSCGSAPALPNGQLVSQSYPLDMSSSPGDTLTYDCNFGYAMSGNSIVTCDPQCNLWTAMPVCTQAGCGYAPYFANAAVVDQNFTASNSIPGSMVRFRCNTGYRLQSGSDVFVYCSPQGLWSNGPVCEASCGAPPTLLNGQIVDQSHISITAQPGDTVSYACNPGFEMEGSWQSTCMHDGGWSVPPQCFRRFVAPQYCQEPPEVVNGDIVLRNYGSDNQPSPGDSVTYGCHEGYVLSGQINAYCENATLSFKPVPICKLLRTCGNNPQLLNGRIMSASFSSWLQGRPGDTITYACNSGYTMVSGNPTIVCDENLLWGALPICMIMCPQPPAVINGRIVATNYSSGNKLLPSSTVTYGCENTTFAMRGSATVTCTSQGRWTTTPLCISNTCGDAPTVANGEIVSRTFRGRASTQSDMVTYACNGGYVIYGNSQVYCDRTLNWSPTPLCILSCGGPPAGVSANVAWRNFTGNSSVPGSMIRYTCVDNQQMQGFAIQVCGENGQWTPSAPTCGPPPSCGSPPTLRNGALVSKSFNSQTGQVGDVLSYSCNRGYFLVGSPAVTCDPMTLTWQTLPICIVTCYDPPKIPNALVDWMNFTNTASVVGSTAHYICSSGFGINGPDMVSCLPNGEWSQTPTCKNLTCGPAPAIRNGRISGTTFGNKSSQPGDLVSYDCNTGYSIQGEETIDCEGGTQQWSPTPRCIENPTCGPLPSITNGYVVRTNLVSGSTQKAGFLDSVSFACDDGYEMEGPGQVVCAGDPLAWSELPTCKFIEPSCPDAPTLSTGYIQSINFADNRNPRRGDTVSYGCSPGWVISGNPTITCDGNPLQWTEMPTCLMSCGYPPAVLYGNITSQNFTGPNSVTGSSVTYACIGGTVMTAGSPIVTCKDGKWSEIPKCEIVTCGDPPEIDNGFINQTTFTGHSSPGDLATYTCNRNHAMSGASTARCDRKTLLWVGVPSCTLKPGCGDPPFVINGKVLTTSFYPSVRSVVGDTVTYGCDPGHRMVGQSTASCDPRTLLWINVPTCQYVASCGPPPLIAGARVSWSNVTNEDAIAGVIVRYECTAGLILQGSSLVSCGTDGQWSQMPVCTQAATPRCPDPPRIVNAHEVSRSFANDDRIEVGDYVTYDCDDGYSPIGRTRVICMATGDWAIQLVCNGTRNQLTDCGTAPNVVNAHIITRTSGRPLGLVGDTLTYQCNQGFALTSSSGIVVCERVSRNNFRWSQQPVCGISCGPSPVVQGSVVVLTNFTGDQSTVNSVVHYQCVHDHLMRGPDKAYCQSNGEWSQAPICESTTPVNCLDNPPYLVNGYEVMRSFDGRVARVGDFVSISCQPGYTRIGDDVIVCLPTGSWSAVPECKGTGRGRPNDDLISPRISCGRAPVVPGARIRWRRNGVTGSRNSQPGDWIEYMCVDPNSDLQGSQRVRCQNDGTWTRVPSCVSRVSSRTVNCGNAPVITNAILLDKTFTINAITGDRATYTCASGYVLVGNAEIRCTFAGWSTIPRCLRVGRRAGTLISCGGPPTVENAMIQQSDFTSSNSRSGSRVVYRCLDGYMLSSSSTSTTVCTNNGRWTAPPQCVAISRNSLASEGCSKPPLVTHGSILYKSYLTQTNAAPYGAIVMYDCDDGYRMTTGNSFIQCTMYSNWTEPPVCAPRVQCGLPPLVNYARVVSRTFDGSIGRATDRVFYDCLPGYSLDTEIYYVECSEAGAWSTIPQCVKKVVSCGAVPRPDQSRLVYKSFQRESSVGDVAWFSCIIGHRLVGGSEVVTCQEDSQWSPLPECASSSGNCEAPPSVPSADIYYQSFPAATTPIPGDYVRYRCDIGLRIQGDHDETICTVAGTWTDPPNCVQLIDHEESMVMHCNFPPIVRNGRVTMATFDRETNEPSPGDYVMYTCNSGYVLDKVDSTSTCTVNGTWTIPPTCTKAASTCGSPPIVSRGYISQPYKTPTLPGTEVSYSCANGHKMIGNAKVSCQLTGKWSSAPQCQAAQQAAGCGGSPKIDNSIVLESNFYSSASRIGSYFTVSCRQPYVLHGNSRIECLQTNEWSDTPTCIARDVSGTSCGSLPSVENANVSFTTVPPGDRGIAGDLIWFQCKNGLQPSTYPGVRCMPTGQWSQLPTCIEEEVAVCPHGINMLFVFDINKVEAFSRDSDLSNIVNFLDSLPLRWQALISEMSANGSVIANNVKLGLAGVTMTGMARREYLWKALNVSSDTSYNSQAWRNWIQKNVAQFKHAFKDDLMKLFRLVRTTALSRLPFTNNNRIVYITTARRGSSLIEASTEVDALKAEPWNARVFTLAIGSALGGQAQQTVLREEISSDSSYFKFVSKTQDLRIESLARDRAFANFLCS